MGKRSAPGDPGAPLPSPQSADALILPHAHAFSLETASQASGIAADPPDGVIGCCAVSPGLVLLTLRAGSPSGYGLRDWPLLVGGAGVGDEPAFVLVYGGVVRSPLAVRFAAAAAAYMHGVDDAYFCGGSFWDGLGDRPTLRQVQKRATSRLRLGCSVTSRGCAQIAERAVETLRGPLPLDEADRERWRGRGGRGAAQASSLSQHRGPLWCRLAAEAQAAGKLRVVDEYRRMARCPDLVAPAPVLRAEWLVPALRPLVAGDAHAPPSSGEALLRAARAEPLADGIVAFDLFEPRFCELLLAEADADEASLAPHDPWTSREHSTGCTDRWTHTRRLRCRAGGQTP